jgi:protein TonB
MSHAMPQAFLDLDAKRILATAGAIAVHIAALMLLLAPVQWTPAPKAIIDDPPVLVVEDIEEIRPIDPPPQEPRPVEHRQQPQPQVQAAPEAPPVVTDEQFAMAIPYVEPVVDPTPVQSFVPPGPVALAVAVGPAPSYPGREARMGITGRVMLRVEVDADGHPTSVTIEHSSGNSVLDRVARETVLKKWRFVPAQRNGVNVAATGLVPIDFVLE